MTRKENLIALRDAVVGGDIGSAPFWKVWLPENEDGHIAYLANSAAQSDMNAALAFVAEVLPKRYWNLAEWDGAWTAQIPVSAFKRYEATSEHSPARALLIAALNALIEETDE